MKTFNEFLKDSKLYYFKGRNTPVVAKDVNDARRKKKRGSDELDTVREPDEKEKEQIRQDRWVTTRKDGKSKEKSRFGHGRGCGPSRK